MNLLRFNGMYQINNYKRAEFITVKPTRIVLTEKLYKENQKLWKR